MRPWSSTEIDVRQFLAPICITDVGKAVAVVRRPRVLQLQAKAQEITMQDRHIMPGPHIYPGLPRVQLEIIRGRARNRMRTVDSAAFLVGTTGDCDLVLGDLRFPSAHAYFLRSRQGVSIRYLGAGPELTVNGEPVQTTILRDGDRIRTGTYEFRIHIRWPQFDPHESAAPSGTTTPPPEQEMQEVRSQVKQLLSDIRAATETDNGGLRLRVYQETVSGV